MWTKNIQIEINYLKSWLKHIEISTLDSSKTEELCLACKFPMKPFLIVENRDSISVLDKNLCPSCGYCHFTKMPSKDWFENFYSSDWDTFGEGVKERLIHKDLKPHPNINMLTKIAPNLNARILDIGAGYGNFLQSARNKGYVNIHGIEPSEHRSHHCRNYLNLDVTSSNVENCIEIFQSEGTSLLFDVIHSYHVLEHAYDIDIALKNFYQMLKPGGVVFFVVPNWIEMESVITMSHFLGHIRHFTPKSFVLLLQRHGFQVTHVDDSLSIIGRKPASNEYINDKEKLLAPELKPIEEMVEKKIVNELLGGDAKKFMTDHNQKRFWLATRVNKSTHQYESNLSYKEKIKWRIKKITFGICHNDEAIRGSTGNLLRLFNLRLVFSKCLARVLKFEIIELGGLLTIKSPNNEGKEAPLLKFSYGSQAGIAKIK